jgi:hypothetical protein
VSHFSLSLSRSTLFKWGITLEADFSCKINDGADQDIVENTTVPVSSFKDSTLTANAGEKTSVVLIVSIS